MKAFLALLVITSALSLETVPARAENGCSGVDRTLSKDHIKALNPVIAKQLGVKRIEILQSFRFGSWNILYVNTHQSDETFVFYSANPMQNRYVTLWSGAARVDEEDEIRAWTLKNAPGIPLSLANCFARHVTKDRDQ